MPSLGSSMPTSPGFMPATNWIGVSFLSARSTAQSVRFSDDTGSDELPTPIPSRDNMKASCVTHQKQPTDVAVDSSTNRQGDYWDTQNANTLYPPQSYKDDVSTSLTGGAGGPSVYA